MSKNAKNFSIKICTQNGFNLIFILILILWDIIHQYITFTRIKGVNLIKKKNNKKNVDGI